MKKIIKKIFPKKILDFFNFIFIYIKWLCAGKSTPAPHAIKEKIIKKFAKKHNINIFFETGTYLGQMVSAQINNFKKIITIELSLKLYKNVKIKFSNFKHVHFYLGDSGEIIKGLIEHINEPILFWLDGHYSAGISSKGKLNTPITKEMEAILNHSIKHIILIDDARLFVGENDYPTIIALKKMIREIKPDYTFEVKHDIIRIY